MRTADAPKEPMIIISPMESNNLKCNRLTAAIPRKLPIHDQMTSASATRGGLWV
jgi:hypothetical protein